VKIPGDDMLRTESAAQVDSAAGCFSLSFLETSIWKKDLVPVYRKD